MSTIQTCETDEIVGEGFVYIVSIIQTFRHVSTIRTCEKDEIGGGGFVCIVSIIQPCEKMINYSDTCQQFRPARRQSIIQTRVNNSDLREGNQLFRHVSTIQTCEKDEGGRDDHQG